MENSLKFKMDNFRSKMHQLGRPDVANGGKHGQFTTKGDPPNKDMKKPRKGEIKFLPEYPEGIEDHHMEEAREDLVYEMMKAKPDGSVIKKWMDVKFALCRKEVVKDKPTISRIMPRWSAVCHRMPGLYHCFEFSFTMHIIFFVLFQVFLEFNRVVGMHLTVCLPA